MILILLLVFDLLYSSLVYTSDLTGFAFLSLPWQLRIEQRRGRVFDGWREGKIYFPPTYKYSHNSDRYASENLHPEAKRRTPAW